MKFKNDKERLAFLDSRSTADGWYIWKHDGELDRNWWRFDFPDCSIIVEEQLQTIHWPDTHTIWNILHWYIVSDWYKPFADSVASRTLALALVKKEEKRNEQSG